MLKHLQALRHRLQERRRYAKLLEELERINAADDSTSPVGQGGREAFGDRR